MEFSRVISIVVSSDARSSIFSGITKSSRPLPTRFARANSWSTPGFSLEVLERTKRSF
jgi:hypothetical protein